MKPSGPGLLFAGRFLTTVWISLLVMGLLRSSMDNLEEMDKFLEKYNFLILFLMVLCFLLALHGSYYFSLYICYFSFLFPLSDFPSISLLFSYI